VLTSPGTWTTSDSSQHLPAFVLFDENQGSQLKDFVHGYISPSVKLAVLLEGTVSRPARVLIFGNSVDRIMLGDVCNSYRGGDTGNFSFRPFVSSCRRPNFSMTAFQIPGSSREGPWHAYPNGSHPIYLDNPYVTIPEVILPRSCTIFPEPFYLRIRVRAVNSSYIVHVFITTLIKAQQIYILIAFAKMSLQVSCPTMNQGGICHMEVHSPFIY
jgi:hypothetical protein